MKIKCLVVGLHHYHDDLVFDTGMPVSVVFDEENEHSECAFKVLTEGGLFGGYLAESQYYWGSLATRLGAKLSFELKSLLNQGYTISEAVVEEIRGRALKYTKVVLEITLNEPTETSEEVSEEMEEDNMEIKVIGNREGLFTLVGVQYYTDEVEIGAEVELRVTNNTTFGYDQNGEPLGVCPQKDSKVAECNELGLRVIRNQDMKEAEELLATKYTVVGFITKTTDNKVSKFAVLDIAPITEETTTPEPVVEETTTPEPVVEAETEAEMEIDEMEIREVLANDTTLKEWVAERNKLTNEVSILNEQLRRIEAELEYTEAKISERVEAMTLIHQIKDKLASLDIEDLRKIHNEVINDSASSDEEEDTSSSSNEEINNNGGIEMEERYDYSIIFEKGDEKIIKLANEINDVLIQMIDNSPLKGEPTMFDIGGIDENTVYARLDFNISDLATPNLEKKICDAVKTILYEKHLIFSMDTMPNVDAEDEYYYYPIEIKQ